MKFTSRLATAATLSATLALPSLAAEASGKARWSPLKGPSGHSMNWAGNQALAFDLGRVSLSRDGLTWSQLKTGNYEQWNAVVRTNAEYIAVGIGDSIMASPDGKTWSSRAWDEGDERPQTLQDAVWTGEQLVAVGDRMVSGNPWNSKSNNLVTTSTDGITFTTRTFGSGMLQAIVWTGQELVAVGGWMLSNGKSAGTVYTSPDGSTWTKQKSGLKKLLYGLAWTGTHLVAVGEDGMIATSSDGRKWTRRKSGTSSFLTDVVWTGTDLVAVGEDGIILRSQDGTRWNREASGTDEELVSVIWTGTRLVVLGEGIALTSP